VTESLKYVVERNIGDIQIRRYPEFLIATVDGMADEAAFRILFDYIAGNNRSKKELPMTVPVISRKEGKEEISMTTPVISKPGSFSFAMPSKYTLDTIPEPSDKKVRILKVRSRTVAVLEFGGRTNEGRVKKHEDELVRILNGKGVKMKGESFLMRYNGPFTPGFMRRNEVAIEIETQ
jgi:hypothetical protein